MNTASAYGACCLTIPNSDEPVVSQLPCHQIVEDQDEATSAEECCLLCVSMTGNVGIVNHFMPNTSQVENVSIAPLVVGVIDPPFRPPISHLS